jgi:hypothetical protein
MAALRQGLIEPADLAVLLAIVQSFEFMGRRCWAEWSDLVQLTGLQEEAVRASAGRLLAAELVACGRDADRPSWWHWKLSPLLVTDCRGTRQAEARRWAEWRQLLAAGCRPDDRVSGTRLRFLRQKAREREQKAAARAAEAQQPARVLVAALAPETPADRPAPARGVQRPPAAAAPAGGAGGQRQQQPEPAGQTIRRQGLLSEIGSRARVVDVRPTPEQRAAEAEWQAQADEARRARAAA